MGYRLEEDRKREKVHGVKSRGGQEKGDGVWGLGGHETGTGVWGRD